jgi:hypothetical protein
MSGLPYRLPQRSAAASGSLPRRTSNTVILVRSCLLGQRADRIAPYKVIRQAGAARNVRGALCERDARLRHVEGSNVLPADRTRKAASQPARAVHGWPQQRVTVSQTRGDRGVEQSASPAVCVGAGLRSSRGSSHADERTTTVRPDFGASVPLPGPSRANDEGDAHRRETTWRALDDPTRARICVPTLVSLAQSS